MNMRERAHHNWISAQPILNIEHQEPAPLSNSQYQPNAPVRSPCVRLCRLNDADVCMGCGRVLREITHWLHMTEDQQRAAVALAAERLARMPICHSRRLP